MSANRLKHSESGFTLIEVTLAIVIGVVVIAGATVLYNQAKASAANSAAQGKVNAAAATVEEYSARNFGRFPTAAQFTAAWKRNRPDDFNLSPWGGLAGGGAATDEEDLGINASDTLLVAADDMTAATDAYTEPTWVGAIAYRRTEANSQRQLYDLQLDATRSVRGFAVWIYNGKGEGPQFLVGGK